MKDAQLGELEKEVMNILWKYKNCSTREVLTKLPSDKKLAYTTVATILQRLYDKGLVTREEHTTAHIYSSKVSKERYTKNVAQSFLKKFINSFGDTAIASFADSIDKLPDQKKKYFLRLLEDHEKNK